MTERRPQPGKSGALPAYPSKERYWVPYLVLAISLLLTAIAGTFVYRTARTRDRLRFQTAVQRTHASIQSRLDLYASLLGGTAGLFDASNQVTRTEFHTYVTRLLATGQYKGIQGIGFSLRVPRDGENALIERLHGEGQKNIHLWAKAPAPEKHAIIYLEPEDERNLVALGYNMFSEETRRAAMIQARDTGEPAASGRVFLVQEIKGPRQPGFLIYYPVYRKGAPVDTVEERRQALLGFVYSPFRMGDLLKGILSPDQSQGIDFTIYDGPDHTPDHLLHEPETPAPPGYRPMFRDQTPITVAGRPWIVVYETRPSFDLDSNRDTAPVTVLAGVLVSFLLFGIIWFQVKSREAAERSADELRRSEARARRLVESNVIGVVFANANGEITEANDAFLGMVGFTREDLKAGHLRWTDLTPPEFASLDAMAIEEVKTTGRLTPYEKEYFRKDGSRVPILIGAALLEPDGNQVVSFFVDLTERKRAERAVREGEERLRRMVEEALEARAEAETANRLKDEFLATVSHELRTPLNAILGYSQLLQMGHRTPEQMEKGLEAIERNVKSQAQLINDLLDVSRIVSGKLRLDVQPLDPSAVVHAAIEAVAPAAQAKEIRLQEHLEAVPAPMTGDPNRLQQVVWNLLSNAIKFTPPGGRVEVSARPAGENVEIAVSDTGTGIAPEFLPHVFDRFRQMDSSSTRRYGGLGLGLSIVRHLVELHGGTVCAESAGEGQGARFIVTLPYHAEPEEREALVEPAVTALSESPASVGESEATEDLAEAPSPAPRLKGVRVLLVEDEPDTRELVRATLAEYGAEVCAVPSAQEAIEALKTMRADVLISDIGLPDEDGYSLIRRVRALGPEKGANIPAAALTAFARDEDRKRALLAGFQTHVTKPIDSHALVDVVATLAGRKG